MDSSALPEYSICRLEADIDAPTYMERYRDAERFMRMCRACPAFGTSWVCPPLGPGCEELLQGRERVLVRAVKITPARKGLPQSLGPRLMAAERPGLERTLLELERSTGGRALIGIGPCTLCAGGCARPLGQPCRRPDRVRPSLEAMGFDVGRTLADLAATPLLWGRDGLLPDYLVIAGAVFA